MSNPAISLPPGFRFYPTDEELIVHYLRNRAASTPCPISIVAEIDIYKSDPWDLPAKAMFGDREWYFFSPRDRKYPNGMRPNRSAASGYWKATGTDKPIHSSSGDQKIGVKKALVFYKGKPPKGIKTNWIMHEYRLAEASSSYSYKPLKLRDSSMRLDDWVLCRIYKKDVNLLSMEDDYVSTSQENITLKLQKSFSISEFLDDYTTLSPLFDNLPEMLGTENDSLAYNSIANQPFIDGNESPALITGNCIKRQRPAGEETTGVLHSSKKPNDPCNFTNYYFANQSDTSQYNMIMNQPLLNEQLLLKNSHLGQQ